MPTQTLLRVASILLLLLGIAYLNKGITLAWNGRDGDYQERAKEYASYSKGIYPNRRLEVPGRERSSVHSVYPPYAFPMMKAFFWTEHVATRRLLIQSLSLAAFAALAWQGRAAFAGSRITLAPWQFLAIPLAFSGNATEFQWGQFSIPCMGLLALQVMFLQKNKPTAAGLCWAFAMIKPHIALPFAMLFPLQRQWKGLLWGGMLLVGLSAWALWHTGVSPSAFLSASPATEKLNFARHPYAGGLWVSWTGIPPRTATAMGIGISLLAIAAGGSAWLRNRLSLLPAAGFCGLLAYALFYHRRYDNMLLFPLLAVTLAHCIARPTRTAITMTAAFAATAFMPAGIMMKHEILNALTLLVPLASAAWLWTDLPRKES